MTTDKFDEHFVDVACGKMYHSYAKSEAELGGMSVPIYMTGWEDASEREKNAMRTAMESLLAWAFDQFECGPTPDSTHFDPMLMPGDPGYDPLVTKYLSNQTEQEKVWSEVLQGASPATQEEIRKHMRDAGQWYPGKVY